MLDDATLRQAARDAIRTERLPCRHPDAMWGGPGAGAPCAICGRAVQVHEPELELEFVRNGNGARDQYHVHPRCFAIWELERHPSAQNGAAPPPNGMDFPAGRASTEQGPTPEGEGFPLRNGLAESITPAGGRGPHKPTPA